MWKRTSSMRSNRTPVVYFVYDGVDLTVIWDIIQADLPQLAQAIERTLREYFPDSSTA